MKVKRFRTDNGGDYVSHTLTAYFHQKGIDDELPVLYSHESNRVTECFSRTITSMARTSMATALDLIDKRLWAKAIATAV